MRAIRILLVFMLLGISARSQEIVTSFSYQYLYSGQWDKAIQTYNFSRPVNTEAQPLLQHGIDVSVAYLFKSTKNFNHGIGISYVYCRSKASNVNLENTLNYHLLNPGYVLHYAKAGQNEGFYADLGISAVLGGLFRKINGDAFVFDEKKAKALGIGGQLRLTCGYRIHMKGSRFISPFVSAGYAPYFFSPDTEAIINQTKGLTGKPWTSIISVETGVSFHFGKAGQE